MSEFSTLLITINLQECFLLPKSQVKGSISRGDAFRLLGTHLSCGPLGMFINWFNHIPEDGIQIVHLKTIDPEENKKENENLIFDLEKMGEKRKNQHVIEISGVNAIFHTDLKRIVKEHIEKFGESTKVGIIGLNAESTLLFLTYELVTRLGLKNVSTCRHLAHSTSKLCFDSALLQLSTILKTRIFQSITEFQNHFFFDDKLHVYRKSLQQSQAQTPLITKIPENYFDHINNLRSEINTGGKKLNKNEEEVLRYLYRGSSSFQLKPLNEGFGGCHVYRVRSKDWSNMENAVTVLKIGNLKTVAREKNNFDRVADVLGNNAPSIVDYVEVGDKAGIKFSIASMDADEEVNSFKKIFLSPNGDEELIERTIKMTFDVVLGRFYKAGKREPIDLFQKYNFDGKGWNYRAGGTDPPNLIRERVEKLLGQNGKKKILEIPGFGSVRNVAEFMENDLEVLKANFMKIKPTSYVSYVHGDMNGNNILLDGNQNVWLIDFEYTCLDHILKDTLKLEADILWEYTEIKDESDMKEAMIILRNLLQVKDIGQPLVEMPDGVHSKKFKKAWKAVRLLRHITSNIAGEDRSTIQLDIVMLRYALFMMTLDHIKKPNQIFCLAAACGYAELLEQKMRKNREIYINWFEKKHLPMFDGRLGISILPGSRQSSLKNDILKLKKEKVDVLYVFCSDEELLWKYDRKEELERESKLASIAVKYHAIPDQGNPSLSTGKIVTTEISGFLKEGKSVCVISNSGLGRCGVICACVLLQCSKVNVEEAVHIVRKTRNPRAIENGVQEIYVRRYFTEVLKRK